MAQKISIYTDGSCHGNPGPGGWCAIVLEEQKNKLVKIATLKGHETDTTNNRMEMIAAIEGLRYIHDKKLLMSDITLYSDSSLVINTLMKGWKRKANKDLWEELDEMNEELNVQFEWVKGHAKSIWNNECDKVANLEANKAEKVLKKGGTSPLRNTTSRKSSQAKLFE
jgi:ribonuclease HI